MPSMSAMRPDGRDDFIAFQLYGPTALGNWRKTVLAWLALAWVVAFALVSATMPVWPAEQNGVPDAAGAVATLPSGVTVTLTTTAGVFGGTTFTASGAAFAGNPAGSYNPTTLNLGATSFNLTTPGTPQP